MGLYEEAWDAEDKRYKENHEKNMKYFESLTDRQKFELMWKDYVEKHSHDIRHS